MWNENPKITSTTNPWTILEKNYIHQPTYIYCSKYIIITFTRVLILWGPLMPTH